MNGADYTLTTSRGDLSKPMGVAPPLRASDLDALQTALGIPSRRSARRQKREAREREAHGNYGVKAKLGQKWRERSTGRVWKITSVTLSAYQNEPDGVTLRCGLDGALLDVDKLPLHFELLEDAPEREETTAHPAPTRRRRPSAFAAV